LISSETLAFACLVIVWSMPADTQREYIIGCRVVSHNPKPQARNICYITFLVFTEVFNGGG
jgi:hypothetical protein